MITEIFEPEVMLPPVGAGILALHCRAGDDAMLEASAPLNAPMTWAKGPRIADLAWDWGTELAT